MQITFYTTQQKIDWMTRHPTHKSIPEYIYTYHPADKGVAIFTKRHVFQRHHFGGAGNMSWTDIWFSVPLKRKKLKNEQTRRT